MSDDDLKQRLLRVRRPPPPFSEVVVVERREVSPRMLRLTLAGEGLRSLEVSQPAMSVRFIVPWPGSALELPEWNGNEFLLADGTRPALRTFTPLRPDNASGRLDLEIVRHPGGAVSEWAERAEPGSRAALSGPGAGYDVPVDADRLLVLGDETAIPAITQLIAMSPAELDLDVRVEVVSDEARLDLDLRDGDRLTWYVTDPGEVPGGKLVAAVQTLDRLPDRTFVWAAGEASAVQAIRTHLFGTLGAERARASIRGYWKPER